MKPGFKKPTLVEFLQRRGMSWIDWLVNEKLTSWDDVVSRCNLLGMTPPDASVHAKFLELFPAKPAPLSEPEPTKLPAEEVLEIEQEFRKVRKKKFEV